MCATWWRINSADDLLHRYVVEKIVNHALDEQVCPCKLPATEGFSNSITRAES
jgi:hypothetical protein